MPKTEMQIRSGGVATINQHRPPFTNEGDCLSAAEKERIFQKRYAVFSLQGANAVWNTFNAPMRSLLKQEIKPLFQKFYANATTVEQEMFDEQIRLKREITSPETIFTGLLDKRTQELVGFTYAFPSGKFHKDALDILTGEISEEDYYARQQKTAEFGWTIIHPDHRAKGGWSHMMQAMEDKLRETNKYEGMIRVVRLANNYADKVRARYDGQISNELPAGGSYGPQLFFRIQLEK